METKKILINSEEYNQLKVDTLVEKYDIEEIGFSATSCHAYRLYHGFKEHHQESMNFCIQLDVLLTLSLEEKA